MEENGTISLFVTAPEGLTKEEWMAWLENLNDEDFKPLIVE